MNLNPKPRVISDWGQQPVDPEDLLGALVVGPGDQLIISVARWVEVEDVARFKEQLSERFGDRVAIVVGVEQMAVLTGPPPTDGHPVPDTEESA